MAQYDDDLTIDQLFPPRKPKIKVAPKPKKPTPKEYRAGEKLLEPEESTDELELIRKHQVPGTF